MEKELNYLSEKIDSLDADISIFSGVNQKRVNECLKEKELLENILNKLTEIELQ